MKKILLFFTFIFFTIQGLHSQSLYCEIKGRLTKDSPYKYAFLNDAKSKNAIFTRIINGHFLFKINKEDNFKMVTIFLGKDSLKTYEQSIREHNNSRFIAVEDLDIIITTDVLNATVNGGRLNKDIDEMYLVMKSGAFESFFSGHKESPVSLVLLKSLVGVNRNPALEGILDLKLFYSILSDNLKKSEIGVQLKKTIDD